MYVETVMLFDHFNEHCRSTEHGGRTAIDPHQTGFVGKGNDHLQLIKFWPSAPLGMGLRWGDSFGSALLQPARSVCISLSAFFIPS